MQKKAVYSIAILFTILFLVMVGFGIIIPIMPFYIKKLGGGSTAIGLFMSVYSVMQFFFAPFWGRLSDRIGRRPVLLIGLSGYALTFILFGLLNSLWLMIAVRALSGMISSATLPTAMAYLADVTEGSERSKSMGIVGAAMGLGMVFGPALGGWLGHYSYSMPFFVAGGLATLLIPFAWTFLPESLPAGAKQVEKDKTRLSWAVVRHPLFVLFLLAFVMNFTMAMFEATFALLAAEKIGFGPKQMGTMFTFLGLIGVVIQGGLLGRLSRRLGDARLIKAGTWLSGAGLLLIIASANKYLMYLGTAVNMVGGSLQGPTTSSLASKANRGSQGAAMGLLQSFASLGRILGPLSGGALYGIHRHLPYWSGALLIFAVIIFSSDRITALERVAEIG